MLSSDYGKFNWKDVIETNNKNANQSNTLPQSTSLHRHHLLINHLPGLLETEPLFFSCVYGTVHLCVLNEKDNENSDLPTTFSSDLTKKGGTCFVGREQKEKVDDIYSIKHKLKYQQHRLRSRQQNFYTNSLTDNNSNNALMDIFVAASVTENSTLDNKTNNLSTKELNIATDSNVVNTQSEVNITSQIPSGENTPATLGFSSSSSFDVPPKTTPLQMTPTPLSPIGSEADLEELGMLSGENDVDQQKSESLPLQNFGSGRALKFLILFYLFNCVIADTDNSTNNLTSIIIIGLVAFFLLIFVGSCLLILTCFATYFLQKQRKRIVLIEDGDGKDVFVENTQSSTILELPINEFADEQKSQPTQSSSDIEENEKIKNNEENCDKEENDNSLNDALPDSFYKSKFGDSYYAAKEIDKAKRNGNVMPVGHFPILAWTKEGVGRVDWAIGTRCKYEPIPDKRLLGNGNQALIESFLAAELFCSNNKEILQIKYKRDVSVHIWPSDHSKGGFSAGCALTMSIISECKEQGFRSGVAFLGEISEKEGFVIDVSGESEKVQAGKDVGINTIIAPRGMEKAIDALPKNVKSGINFIFISNILEALSYLQA